MKNLLIKHVLAQPQAFNFFQAVRLLENCFLRSDLHPDKNSVKINRYLSHMLKFSVNPALEFSPASIDSIEGGLPQGNVVSPLRMWVNFMGLAGASGVLPVTYTERLLHDLRDKNPALQEFLQIFEHRSISLFYRSWKKYFFPADFEQAKLRHQRTDVEKFLSSLTGSVAQNNHSDDLSLFYAGHFATQARSATALQQILAEYFQVAVQIEQFQGEWVRLATNVRSSLPTNSAAVSNHCLGVNMVAGSQVWQCQNKFRIKLGPLSNRQLMDFLPDKRSGAFATLCRVVRRFVDSHLTFDVQVRLKRDEIPVLQLNTAAPSQLGFNSWLFKREFATDVTDVVLRESGAAA